MKVLVISQFFAPEPCAAANRVGALTQALARDGHDVTVLTGMPSFPEGVVQPAYRGRAWHAETIDGVRVERVWTYASTVLAAGNRLANWASVALGVTLRSLMHRNVDLIVVSSPPITLALPALVARFVHRAPLVVDIRDVFPEVAVAMGAWKADAPLTRIVGGVADALYRAASRVVAVTPAAQSEIASRGVAGVLLAPNGFDAVEPSATSRVARVPGEFSVAYVGNMGLATGLDVVVDAAAALPAASPVRFVLVGDGADAARLRARVAAEGLADRVRFAGVLPRAEALRVLVDADATVVPLVATIRDSLPTKMFDAMAVGCPVVVSAAGEAQRVVEASGGGLAVEPGNGPALAAALVALAGDAPRRAAYAAAGRTYVREHYDRERIMARLARAIAASGDQPAVTAIDSVSPTSAGAFSNER